MLTMSLVSCQLSWHSVTSAFNLAFRIELVRDRLLVVRKRRALLRTFVSGPVTRLQDEDLSCLQLIYIQDLDVDPDVKTFPYFRPGSPARTSFAQSLRGAYLE